MLWCSVKIRNPYAKLQTRRFTSGIYWGRIPDQMGHRKSIRNTDQEEARPWWDTRQVHTQVTWWHTSPWSRPVGLIPCHSPVEWVFRWNPCSTSKRLVPCPSLSPSTFDPAPPGRPRPSWDPRNVGGVAPSSPSSSWSDWRRDSNPRSTSPRLIGSTLRNPSDFLRSKWKLGTKIDAWSGKNRLHKMSVMLDIRVPQTHRKKSSHQVNQVRMLRRERFYICLFYVFMKIIQVFGVWTNCDLKTNVMYIYWQLLY